MLSHSRDTSKENLEKQKKLEERKRLMQPTFKKYGIRKRPDEATSLPEDKHYANAGKVCSANVSESGGGEIRSISRGDKSNSPFRNEARYTMDPKELKPIFSTIKEESKETITLSKQKKKSKKVKETIKNKDIKFKDKTIKPLVKDDKLKNKKKQVAIADAKPKSIKGKLAKRVISKKLIKKQPKKIAGDTGNKNQHDKAEIKHYMIKKHKEIRQKQTQRYLEEEQQQQKVLDNLQKLANKPNSKSTINIYKINDNERSDLAMTLNKNMSLLKSSSKNTLSTHKLLKTQRKPKTKKIKPKVDSPSKLLSSDSELEEMSPREYLKY